MEHYQIHKACGVCGLNIIADIFAIGVSHEQIVALTHEACAAQAGGKIMGEGEVEKLNE